MQLSGTFVSGEQPTSGSARIIFERGQRYVELAEDFQTSELGPDLHVALHRLKDVIGSTVPPEFPLKEEDYVILYPLQSFTDKQLYSISENLELRDYQLVVIHCVKFNAAFGAAQLHFG